MCAVVDGHASLRMSLQNNGSDLFPPITLTGESNYIPKTIYDRPYMAYIRGSICPERSLAMHASYTELSGKTSILQSIHLSAYTVRLYIFVYSSDSRCTYLSDVYRYR